MHRSPRGFTLIELLIVVAIIAILAAIAVPNFLEAQTRAKLSRLIADMRTIAIAEEAYIVDHNDESPCLGFCARNVNPTGFCAWFLLWPGTCGGGYVLTTPIAYITSIPFDPFSAMRTGYGETVHLSIHYAQNYRPMDYVVTSDHIIENFVYMLRSPGPNGHWFDFDPQAFYDPTNGTISPGDIWYEGQHGFISGPSTIR